MQRLLWISMLCLVLGLPGAVCLSGCTTVKKYPLTEDRPHKPLPDNLDLKGLTKVEVIEQLGAPLATSKSDVSECWYYAAPDELWIWFKDNEVERWEAK